MAKSAKDKESYLFLSMLLGCCLSFVAALIVEGPILPRAYVFTSALCSGIFEGLYLYSLVKTFRHSAMGTSYAIMRGGAMIFVWVFSLSFVGEVASPIQYVGTALVFLGICAMNAKEGAWKDMLSVGNIWAYLSAFFIAGYHVFYHQALHRGAQPLSLFTISVAVSLPFLFFAISQDKVQRLRSILKFHWRSVFSTAVLSTLSFVIFLYGLKITAPGFAISLRNTSIFFAILFSYFLKESLSRAQLIGALTIGIGAIFLSI